VPDRNGKRDRMTQRTKAKRTGTGAPKAGAKLARTPGAKGAAGRLGTTQHLPTGWNTWDFQGFNRLVYLENGDTVVTIEFSVWDETVPARVPPPDPEHRKIGKLYDNFRWDNVTKLGPHAPLGLPAKLEFLAGEVPYAAEATEKNGTLQLTVKPLKASKQRIVFRMLAPVGVAPVVTKPTQGTFAGCALTFKGATWPTDYYVNIAEPYAVAPAGKPATVVVKPPRAQAGAAPGEFAALAKQALTGSGALADAPGAMMQAITWNTLYDTRRKLISSPVSRDWCYDWRGVLVFCWDTFLVSTFVSYEAPELTRLNQESVCAAIDELGHVPNYYMAHGAASRDRSMPCLGAYLIWKTQLAAPDKAWLARVYPKLVRWHGYWMKNRSGRKDGLLQWGSNPVEYEFPQLVPYNQILQHTRQSAMYESGLDNSPMFDDVAFNAQRNVLELDDIMLCSLYAMDCEALANMAAFLGKPAEAARFRKEHAEMGRKINECLWDEEHGIYCNRHWDSPKGRGGKLTRRWAPTSLFPLIAGVATPERAARMVREHLLNEQEFWGDWVIPAIARNDPAYPDNDYWRGRIWGPFNFLVSEGLRRYRMDDVAAELATKSLALFMKNYRADGGIYENYNAETGQGADVWNAARLYHWGGLLAFLAMLELIDVEPTGYLRCGSLEFANAGLKNVRLGPDTYEVKLDRGVHVRKNGQPLLDCTTRAIVRMPLATPGLAVPAEQPLTIAATARGTLTLHGVKGPARPARLSDGRVIVPQKRGAQLVYSW